MRWGQNAVSGVRGLAACRCARMRAAQLLLDDCTVDFTVTLNGVSWAQPGQLTLTVQ